MRTTGVRLIAETGQYKREMGASAKATRDVRTELDKTGEAGKKNFTGISREARTLDTQIAATAANIGSLARAFAATGDTGIIKTIKDQQRELRQLTDIRKMLPSDADATKAGVSLGGKVASGMARAIPPPMIAAIAAGGAAAAPLLGAAVSGAIIGGAGIGGVVGGLMIAKRDQRVVTAATELGDRINGRLNISGAGFVQPALDGLKRIEKAVDSINIEQIFADSADYVVPLTEGVAKAVEEIGNGIEDLVRNAGPAVDALSTGIATIGTTLGNGLSDMGRNSQQAADGLRTLLGVVNYSIQSTLSLVNVLTELYDINRKIGGDLGLRLILKATGAEMDSTAESARRVGGGTFGMAQSMQLAADDAEKLKAAQAGVAAEQKALTQVQQQYNASLDALAPKQGRAAQLTDGLRRAQQNLFGATMAQADANQGYEASWDNLSETVQKNTGAIGRNRNNLDVHTAAGRTNRDALKALLTSNNELYFANVATGQSVESATKKHRDRTAQVVKEAEKLGLNRAETRRLIDTYGKIPGRKVTDLLIQGLERIADQLSDLYLAQRALAEGKTVEQLRKTGLSFRGFAEGGWTGPGPKHQPAGVVHADEWVVPKQARRTVERQAPGFLEELNATGQIPGYAAGGLVAPVDTSRRWPFVVNVKGTRVPSRAEVMSKVTPKFGDWPSSPGAQRGDSGVWRRIVGLIKSSGINQGSFGNSYRPGDPKWHGSGRAVDWMGYNMDALAGFLAAKRPLELIHRTNRRDYAYTRGRNMGSFNRSLMEAHRNHIHIAMANGGIIREPVIGVGASGRSYSFAERGPERVLSAGQTAASMGNTTTIHLSVNVAAGVHPAEVGRQTVEHIGAYLKGGGSLWVKGRQVLP